MLSLSRFSRITASLLIGALVVSMTGITDSASAKRKKKDDGVDEAAKIEAEITKALEPIQEELKTLLDKMQGRSLFSPEDAGELGTIKYTLMDLLHQYPDSQLLAKPVFQTATVYSHRQDYQDAYELYQYVKTQFPENPYGVKSKQSIDQLRKKLGEDTIPKDPVIEEAVDNDEQKAKTASKN